MSPRNSALERFRQHQKIPEKRWQRLAFPDVGLLLCWLALIVIGMVMVTSSSLSEAHVERLSTHHFAIRQGIFYVGSSIFAYIAFMLGTNFYREKAKFILGLAFLGLLLVYAPGIGVVVNGSRRWLNLGVINLQVGEFAKLAIFIFTAAYLQHHTQRLDHSWQPIIGLLAVTACFALMFYLQPDFGTMVVIVATVLGMLFLSGVSIWRLLLLGVLIAPAMVWVLISESYRLRRLTTFINPWEYQYDEGYQLVNSLISFGRGGLFGVGLGESVQKHQYLPEAHTDFIFSIIAEETGLVGALIVMAILMILVWRAFAIGYLADRMRKRFSSLLAYGIGLWLGLQSLINIGVTTGALPTKGLTLPLISYGGSSILMTSIALAILARIDAESRFIARLEGKI